MGVFGKPSVEGFSMMRSISISENAQLTHVYGLGTMTAPQRTTTCPGCVCVAVQPVNIMLWHGYLLLKFCMSVSPLSTFVAAVSPTPLDLGACLQKKKKVMERKASSAPLWYTELDRDLNRTPLLPSLLLPIRSDGALNHLGFGLSKTGTSLFPTCN